MNIFEVSSLLLAATSFLLAAVIWVRNRKISTARSWAITSFLAGMWSTFLYGVVTSPSYYWANIWQYGLDITAIFIPVAFLNFTLTLIGKRREYRWLNFSSLFLGLTVVAISVTGLYKTGLSPKFGFNYWIDAGTLYWTFPFLYSLLVIVSAILLVRAYFSLEVEKRLKTQIKFIFGALIFGFLGGLTNFFPQLFDVYPFGNYFVIAYVFFISYPIIRHNLFNIKAVVAEFAVAAILVVNAAQVLSSDTVSELTIQSITFVIIAIFSILLVRSVQNEVKRREEVERLAKEKTQAFDELEERNRNLATLQKISDIVLNESDMKVMTQNILDELPRQLDSCVGGLLSIAKQGRLSAYAISSNNFSKKILSLVGGDLSKYSDPLKRDYSLTHKAVIDKVPVSSEYLSDFISPPLPKTLALSIQKLIGARHIEAFPLIAGGETLGVMVFVFNKSKEQIHRKNYSIAKAISGDMSLAIQRARAFMQLKEANEYLSQLDKMKDEFISMASHELNTPLAAIEGYLSMILDEGMGKIDKQSRMYLNRAYASSKRLAELILDLLNVSRIEQGRLKIKYAKANMTKLAQSVIHELQIKADEKKIFLKLKADKNLPATWCDPDRIREVIVNLTGNAIKFTDKGGITINIKGTPKKIVVSVTDTGRGIAKADQSKLFQKFSQVKREIDEHQGTGLGLYISKNFVELHKGKISIDSDAGKGSTFSFEIPVISKPPKEVEGAILEKSVKSAQIETSKKGDVPKIITDSSKKGV